jgi:hypothetical protein
VTTTTHTPAAVIARFITAANSSLGNETFSECQLRSFPPVDRHQHPDLARSIKGPPVYRDTILGLMTERETTATATEGRLREQISQLSAELTRIDRELATTEVTTDDPTIVSSACQQILAVLSEATVE